MEIVENRKFVESWMVEKKTGRPLKKQNVSFLGIISVAAFQRLWRQAIGSIRDLAERQFSKTWKENLRARKTDGEMYRYSGK